MNQAFRIVWAACLTAGALCVTGCHTLSFYTQAFQGQYTLLRGRQPIAKVLADPATPDPTKRKLELVLELREFAASELHLPVKDHYSTFVDLGRPFAVWNVHAAPEFSLKPKGWWYPFVGRLTYRGYFQETDAREYGQKLTRKDYDVCVEGVETYSTLGWFEDPMLNTLIHHSDITLAEILFHELAHHQVFIAGDTDFNEAFATAVAEEGVIRWLKTRGDAQALQRYQIALKRQRQFVALVMAIREKLKALYNRIDQSLRLTSPVQNQMRAEKERILSEMRVDYERLKAEWNGYSGYDPWFARPVNNAQLNSVAAYFDLVPGFQQMIQAAGGNLTRFYSEAQSFRSLRKPERHRVVRQAAVNPRFQL